ncbi:hypothetical protein BKA62DRAFT_43563 [Auriculariales sp. MPI-PUGE-AT-0066]|nr:hypothetical protein BKA62DRAFT_43563 [Auriculariales sp. MPI-PUGE-AT-0066]
MTRSGDRHRIYHKAAVLYSGKGYHIAVYLVANRTLVNVAVFETELDRDGEILPEREQVQNNVDIARLVAIFSTWEPEAQAIIKVCSQRMKCRSWFTLAIQCMENTTRMGYQCNPEASVFCTCRIAVVGDAAHAMTTHLAGGTDQALEDAYVIGRVLSAPNITRATAHFALQAYSTTRMLRAQAIAEASREVGRLVDWVFVRPGDKDPITDEAACCLELERLSKVVTAGEPEEEFKHGVKEFNRLIEVYRLICYDI